MKKLVKIGKIIKLNGLKGKLKVFSYIESLKTLKEIKEIFAFDYQSKIKIILNVKKIYFSLSRKKIFFIEFKEISNIEQAKNLIGLNLFISSVFFKKLSDDEYYYYQIIGLKVKDEYGNFLGFIKSIITTGSNDVYIIYGGKREILIPAIKDVIKFIDYKNGFMIITLLNGL